MPTFTAFLDKQKIAAGDLATVISRLKTVAGEQAAALIVFDDATGRPVDLDIRETFGDLQARLDPPAPSEARGPGRPRLGVVAREVTLLPRHWDWLGRQSGGASAVLRRLVDQARRDAGPAEAAREARDALYQFMTAMAGDETGYEEAIRALFAGDPKTFDHLTANWPIDIRDHVWTMATRAFAHLPVSTTL